jgi:hypothetical protein
VKTHGTVFSSEPYCIAVGLETQNARAAGRGH